MTWRGREKETVKALVNWEEKSRENPEYIMGLDWIHGICRPCNYVLNVKTLRPVRGLKFKDSIIT